MRITRVYTKTGDDGRTRLGGGQSVDKNEARVEAYGQVDELNASIGVALSFCKNSTVNQHLTEIQHHLFTLGGDLCMREEDKAETKMTGLTKGHVESLEHLIDNLNAQLKPLEEFILPGGTETSAFLHVARCVCRRAERSVVTLGQQEKISDSVIPYLNRLSDALFVLARFHNVSRGVEDIYWSKDIVSK